MIFPRFSASPFPRFAVALCSRDSRLAAEEAFHDAWARQIEVEAIDVDLAFHPTISPETHYALERLGDLKGRRVLDLGCGAGEASVCLARRGARVWAADLSGEMLRAAGRLAERYGVRGRVRLVKVDAEAMAFPSGAFDAVYGFGVLHHLDLDAAATEVARVLRPGGRAVFVEPLKYNPIINLYRWMSPDVHTRDEHPMSFADFERVGRRFREVGHREFQLLALLIHVYFFAILKLDPRTERYWKRAVQDGRRFEGWFRAIRWADRALLRCVPPLRRMSWASVVELVK
ncbi:MAG: hypothetical protein A3F84_05320 [Candidatus Handelsmanbacteria bacterium RIFCSPLOWO2_12_FULL_64_10]|uniref:Methyltransferase type 11 domain-containing protein n=1 Tax=Handelsmanbacteria sp. (strain RIFCSPLOWO2_12_FULL_64_10) TaxID=1817868 RepID=A0A1F6CBW0_HANXR|nr:MAG: hypothetical protein A3F84_05320 [Candidatus Handelsmanbacteria bacterium RIFCSPLOWO2_12_FULL_64_10]